MAEESNDQGNEQILEGGEEIMSGIDEVMSQSAPEGGQEAATTQGDGGGSGGDATAEQQKQEQERVERARDERGRFEKEQREEKEKADRLAKEQQGSEKDYPAEIKSEKARGHFDTIKRQRDDEKRRADGAEIKLKTLETKVQELESRSGTAAPEVKVLQQQLADLQSQLDERERIISFKAVEETGAFREGVSQPMAEAEQTMDEVAGVYSLDSSQINKVLAEPNKFKRSEMLADLTEALPERSRVGVQTALKDAVDKWIGADKKRAELYENAKGNREFAENERQQTEARAALERQQAYQKANEEVDSILKEKLPEIVGDETIWSAIKEKAMKVADFDRMPAKAKAFANLASYTIMPLMKKYRDELAAHQKTKDILAARTKSDPSPAGGRGGVTKVEGDDDYDPNNPLGGLLGGIDATLAGG